MNNIIILLLAGIVIILFVRRERKFFSEKVYEPKEYIDAHLKRCTEQEKSILEQFKKKEEIFLEEIARKKFISDMKKTYVVRLVEYQEFMADGRSTHRVYLDKKKCVRVRKRKLIKENNENKN